MAHSSVRSDEGTLEACARAFVAQAVACVMRCEREGGVEIGKEEGEEERVLGVLVVGDCWAREVERLFTRRKSVGYLAEKKDIGRMERDVLSITA